MDWNKIEQLIEAYYDAETTVDQEKELRDALLREDCPEGLLIEAQMMNLFEQEANVHTDNLNYELANQSSIKRIQPLIYRYSGAAVAAIFFFVFFFKPNPTCNDETALAVINNQIICDETVAKQQIEDALQLVSVKLNQSTSKLNK